jgi:hypothetical protein
LEERLMKLITTLAAAAFIAGSATLAMAQGGGAAGSGGTGASGGIGGVGAGADPATPRQNMTRPTPNTPAVNRRGDEMAPMQGSNVSNPTVVTTKKKKRSMDRTYR